jgi:hypothetical protein
LSAAAALSPVLNEFLVALDFSAVWGRLKQNHRTEEGLLKAFHGWFDGLATLQLIHYLSAGPYPRRTPVEAMPHLLAQAGLPASVEPGELLQLLRVLQGKGFQYPVK